MEEVQVRELGREITTTNPLYFTALPYSQQSSHQAKSVATSLTNLPETSPAFIDQAIPCGMNAGSQITSDPAATVALQAQSLSPSSNTPPPQITQSHRLESRAINFPYWDPEPQVQIIQCEYHIYSLSDRLCLLTIGLILTDAGSLPIITQILLKYPT